jgi:hypothetical protein
LVSSSELGESKIFSCISIIRRKTSHWKWRQHDYRNVNSHQQVYIHDKKFQKIHYTSWPKTIRSLLTLSLLMSYIYGAPSKVRNLTSYIYMDDFLLGILFLEPCVYLIYAWKTNKYTKYSFRLLIMYCSSYMFRHYIAIIRERS